MSGPEPTRGTTLGQNTEEELRAEIYELRLRLEKQHPHATHEKKRPSAVVLWSLAVVGVIVVVVAFFAGYLPQSQRQTALAKEAKDDSVALPIVNIVAVERSSNKSELVLPGDIQAVTEAPILARASGYIVNRYVDIGDRVKQGQLLAEINAPELGQQVTQAKATREQAAAGLDQANANLEQGKTNSVMAGVTAERWNSLVKKGAVAKQDAETFQSQSDALRSNVQALEKAVSAARSSIAAADANLERLTEMEGYLKVRAPFDGVVTQRNIDTGALVTEGQTLLYRVAQTDRLRTYISVPQSDATSVRVGQKANVRIASLPSQTFIGIVTRTANSLDPATRTLLAEVQVPNQAGLLLPGMYAQVDFTTPRSEPPLVIRGDTLVVRSDGPQVAVVGAGDIVHYQRVQLGRDYGDRVEVIGGLQAGDRLVVNPGDSVRNSAKVLPKLLTQATN
jgi:RND family efflux transporter MFP subunit